MLGIALTRLSTLVGADFDKVGLFWQMSGSVSI